MQAKVTLGDIKNGINRISSIPKKSQGSLEVERSALVEATDDKLEISVGNGDHYVKVTIDAEVTKKGKTAVDYFTLKGAVSSCKDDITLETEEGLKITAGMATYRVPLMEERPTIPLDHSKIDFGVSTSGKRMVADFEGVTHCRATPVKQDKEERKVEEIFNKIHLHVGDGRVAVGCTDKNIIGLVRPIWNIEGTQKFDIVLEHGDISTLKKVVSGSEESVSVATNKKRAHAVFQGADFVLVMRTAEDDVYPNIYQVIKEPTTREVEVESKPFYEMIKSISEAAVRDTQDAMVLAIEPQHVIARTPTKTAELKMEAEVDWDDEIMVSSKRLLNCANALKSDDKVKLKMGLNDIIGIKILTIYGDAPLRYYIAPMRKVEHVTD